MVSGRWKQIAAKLGEFDDVIIGVDTNVLYNGVISQQLLDGFVLTGYAHYVHTPNWLLLAVPSSVMHEIEQAANGRDGNGKLSVAGRMGYRALQEILEIDQSKDIRGVSLLIVGEANPVLDARVELRGLREDFKRAARPGVGGMLIRKSSAGDTLIRDQFKAFLRQIGFHKCAYFLTGDKTAGALARAEGLHSIYYPPPTRKDIFRQSNGRVEAPQISFESESLTVDVPLGKLIYELAVQFGTLIIRWGRNQIEISSDDRGDSLEHWINRGLIIHNHDLEKLWENYRQSARISLRQVKNTWNQLGRNLADWI